mgnify:CR=1 FL=1
MQAFAYSNPASVADAARAGAAAEIQDRLRRRPGLGQIEIPVSRPRAVQIIKLRKFRVNIFTPLGKAADHVDQLIGRTIFG